MPIIDVESSQQTVEGSLPTLEMMQSAFEASFDAFYLLRPAFDEDGEVEDFVFVAVNAAAEAQLSMPRDVLLGERLCEVLPVNREQGFFDQYVRVWETGLPLNQEYSIAPGYPAPGWYIHNAIRITDGIAILNRDITELKRTQAHQSAVLATIPDLIVITDEVGLILETHGCERLVDDPELLAEGSSIARLLSPASPTRALDLLEWALTEHGTHRREFILARRNAAFRLEARCRRVTSGYHWPVVLWTIRPLTVDEIDCV
jgi:PAS domain-containing protein